METTLEIYCLGSGDDTGDLASEDWRQQWRLSSWEVEMIVDTWWVAIEDDTGDLAAWDWRLHMRLSGLR